MLAYFRDRADASGAVPPRLTFAMLSESTRKLNAGGDPGMVDPTIRAGLAARQVADFENTSHCCCVTFAMTSAAPWTAGIQVSPCANSIN
jgi:hypothetical protein